jgi:hypothetical protein
MMHDISLPDIITYTIVKICVLMLVMLGLMAIAILPVV